MDGFSGYYAMHSKSNREIKILHELIYMWNERQNKKNKNRPIEDITGWLLGSKTWDGFSGYYAVHSKSNRSTISTCKIGKEY